MNAAKLIENISTQISKDFENFKKTVNPSRRTKNYVSTRLDNLEQNWKNISQQYEILICTSEKLKEDILNNAEDYHEEAKEIYYQYRSSLLDELDKFAEAAAQVAAQAAATAASNASQLIGDQQMPHIQRQHDVRLPKIHPPIFTGEYQNWRSFHDQFVSLVHNNASLTQIEKLHYLKSCCKEGAGVLLEHINVDDASYDKAWQLLTSRYDFKRILVNNELKLLYELPNVSDENPKGIRELLDNSTKILHALKNLEIPVEHWDAIIIFLLLKKLPASLQSKWEITLGTQKEIPTFLEFSNFLETMFRTLEMVDQQQNVKAVSYKRQQKNVFHSEFTESFVCKVCNNGAHSLRTCTKFLQMNINARQQIVKQYGNCFNCLAYSHRTRNCPSNYKCHYCQKPHNSLLHYDTTYNPNNVSNFNNNNHHSFPHNQQNPFRQQQVIQSNQLQRNSNTTNSNTRSQQPSNSFTHTHQNTNRHSYNQSNANNSNANRSQTHHISTELNPNATSFEQYDEPPSTSNCFHLNEFRNTHILLATAIVKVKSARGDFIRLRALVDPGSQATFITESSVQLLGLRKHRTSFEVSVLGQNKSDSCQNFVELTLTSIHSDFSTSTRGSVYKTLTGWLPSHEINVTKLKHIHGLNLADPTFNRPSNIDILLGSDIYCEIVQNEVIRSKELIAPIAQKTELGWLILGKVPQETNRSIQVYSQVVDIDTQIRKFWEIEETPHEKAENQENVDCEAHFLHTIKRVPGGRFEVSLPFKEMIRPKLQSTKQTTLKMFLRQEKKLLSNPTQYIEYNKSLEEYVQLDQMEEVNIDEDNVLNSPYHYVVPHHAVIKESSTTTKLRVVFNASFRTSDGSSLNDHLMTGPKTQTDITAIVLRWRTHKITFTSDIEKMYRQIQIHPEDAYYQLIHWRDNPTLPIKMYKIKVLMFGTAPAPYLANRTLKKLASDEELAYPLAAQMIREDMYIDDLVSGADSLELAKQKYQQISQLLSSAGFHLRKWMSNDKEFLESIPEEDRETSISLAFGSLDHTKTLGIRWFPSTDTFSFQKIMIDNLTTKRTILSTVARLFDPLGWISPFVIKAKIIMQQLWLQGLSWDEDAPVEIQQEWLSFREELEFLDDIHLPRWINTQEDVKELQLHGFSDASMRAYGAVVYLRVLDYNNCISTHLLISKTKVAPVSTVSLPRLELCGAVILAKLLHYTQTVLPFTNVKTFAWTDSSITLSWIIGLPSRWKTFVANRVTEIQRLTNVSMWRHIPTKLNPADLSSRGISLSKLKNNSLWWNGPQFLQDNWEFSVPIQPTQLETDEERREIKTHVAVEQTNSIIDVICKQSKLTKALRIIARVRRFVHNLKKDTHVKTKSILSPFEIEAALHCAVKTVQQVMFEEVINQLNKTKTTKLNKSLNLFIDPFGIVRIGGRLQNANLTYDQKHPIVLKPNHNISRLIIEHAHEKTLHGGIQQVMSYIRNKFWIFNMKRTVKKYIKKCVICFKTQPSPMQQLMGSLPAPRVNVSRPFAHTGVDYAGPIEVKAWKGRGSKVFKGYFAIFICLSTKAIHLEAVTDLTTQAFIAAFRRFTSRRGICSNVYSDCGTNFKGANAELQRMLSAAKHDYSEVAEELSLLGTKWNFIPPASPHFGGLWEAGVKSVKYHLKRVARNQALTFEELSTLLAQIEVCLNSRPLCPVTDSLDDLNTLTPAHFLIGTSLHIVPEANLLNTKIGYLDRWKLLQASLQTFWKEWSGEYLTRLQNRPKWLKIEEKPKVGDLVLLKDERLPPSKWAMARIIEAYAGKDDLIRVVKVRTQNNEMKRPITKICPLPSNDTNEENTLI